jgi:hypothetical protein
MRVSSNALVTAVSPPSIELERLEPDMMRQVLKSGVSAIPFAMRVHLPYSWPPATPISLRA